MNDVNVNTIGRETVAGWMILRGYATGHGDTIQDLLFELEGQLGGQREPPPGEGDFQLLQAQVERLTLENWQLKGALGYSVPGHIPEGRFSCGLCAAKVATISDMLAVLNAARIMLKNRDQRPEEMKLLDAIKAVIAGAEPHALTSHLRHEGK